MRQGLVAGNWKMNGSRESVAELLDLLLLGAKEAMPKVELAIFPPFVFLDQCEAALKNSNIAWGAQNLCDEQQGAYTGEVSASMLKDFYCKYVLIGHSERRTLYNETNSQIAAKCNTALRSDLLPIVCVGETLKQREADLTLRIVEEQLAPVLALQDNLPNFAQAVIAYEPVWAIGTGQQATPEQAQAVHKAIREQLTACCGSACADQMRIVYGGSVKANNAGALFAMPDIDGGLVGGASLDAKQFIEIGKLCNNSYS